MYLQIDKLTLECLVLQKNLIRPTWCTTYITKIILTLNVVESLFFWKTKTKVHHN